MPFPPPGASVDSPYASLLSSGNKLYTHFSNRFAEFDPAKRAFTFCSENTVPMFAMGMTEDDDGVIWSIAYPQDRVVSFNPKTREFKDYGEVYKQNWSQYPGSVAADDAGWIYFGLGYTSTQIVAFDRTSGTAKPILEEAERKKGSAFVYRDLDGKVYGQPLKGETGTWIELYQGSARKIGAHEARPKTILAAGRLIHKATPDDAKITCDLVRRRLVVEGPEAGSKKETPFDYESDGAVIMGEAVAPDGTISGGTAFPMHMFSLDAKKDALTNRPAYGQWNIILADRGSFFVGAYGGGHLLEWQPAKPWEGTDPAKSGGNPAHLAVAEPQITRPSRLLATRRRADGHHGRHSRLREHGRRAAVLGPGPRDADGRWRRGPRSRSIDPQHDRSSRRQGARRHDDRSRNRRRKEGGRGAALCPGPGDAEDRMAGRRPARRPGIHRPHRRSEGPGLRDRGSQGVLRFRPRQALGHREAGCRSRARTRGLPSRPARLRRRRQGGGVRPVHQRDRPRRTGNREPCEPIARSPVQIDTGGAYLNGRIYFSSGSHLWSYELGGTGK